MSVKHNGSLKGALKGDFGDYQYDKQNAGSPSGRKAMRDMSRIVTKKRRRHEAALVQDEIQQGLDDLIADRMEHVGLEVPADCEYEPVLSGYSISSVPVDEDEEPLAQWEWELLYGTNEGYDDYTLTTLNPGRTERPAKRPKEAKMSSTATLDRKRTEEGREIAPRKPRVAKHVWRTKGEAFDPTKVSRTLSPVIAANLSADQPAKIH